MASQEDDLVVRARRDREAVGGLYDRFYELIYRYCFRRFFFPELAEDAASSTFLTMAQRIGDFRGRTLRDFRAWLYVIAANQVSQILRQRLRHERMLKEMAERACRPRNDEHEIRWPALYKALLGLDEEQQHLIALRFFQGLSHEEIAEIVGSREGTVRVRIHRALQQLRRYLQPAMEAEAVWENQDGH